MITVEQSILDRAVKIATAAAMKGQPVKQIIWIPPASATDDPYGNFIVEYEPISSSGASRPSWERG